MSDRLSQSDALAHALAVTGDLAPGRFTQAHARDGRISKLAAL